MNRKDQESDRVPAGIQRLILPIDYSNKPKLVEPLDNWRSAAERSTSAASVVLPINACALTCASLSASSFLRSSSLAASFWRFSLQLMTCQPNWVSTGRIQAPTSSRRQRFQRGHQSCRPGTIPGGVRLWQDGGTVGFFFRSSAKSAPFKLGLTGFASFFCL